MVYIREDIDTLDAAIEVQDNGAQPTDLPSGTYTFAVAKAELRETKSANPQTYLHLPLLVLEGPQKGRLQGNNYYVNDDKFGAPKWKRDRATLGIDLGALGVTPGQFLLSQPHLNLLVGKVVAGAVVRKTKTQGDGEFVTAYLNELLEGYEVPAEVAGKIAWPSEMAAPPSDVPDITDPFADQ